MLSVFFLYNYTNDDRNSFFVKRNDKQDFVNDRRKMINGTNCITF